MAEKQKKATKSVLVSPEIWRKISLLAIDLDKSNGEVLEQIIQEWERGKKGRK